MNPFHGYAPDRLHRPGELIPFHARPLYLAGKPPFIPTPKDEEPPPPPKPQPAEEPVP